MFSKLFNLFKFNKIHRCKHIPIVSKYVSFNTRDIIYECVECKDRIRKTSYFNFSEPLPIDTTPFINNSEMDEIFKNGLPKNE